MALTRPKYSQIYDSDFKNSCRVATGSNVTLIGGAPNSVDGVTLSLYDRVLVRAQTNGAQNGIYFVTTLGTGSNGTWTRSLDADASDKLTPGTTLSVEEGTSFGGKMYRMTSSGPITIGSTVITWTDVSGGGATAGGLNGQIQFNSTNTFGGATFLTYVSGTGLVIANAGIASSSTSTGTMVITGGLGVSGTVYGGAAAFTTATSTNLSSSNAQITGGSVTGGTGAFTTLTATNFTSGNADITGSASQIGVTTAGAVDRIGSIYATTVNPTNFSTANAVITGGSINGSTIGASSASTGAFTTLTATTSVNRNSRNIPTNFTGNTAPASPLQGDEWFQANTGLLYKYLFDNVSSTFNWVNFSSATFNSSTAATANTLALRDSGGNLTATNFIGVASSAKYADLAEIYASDKPYEPSTVVIFGGSLEVTTTKKTHDTRVAGVVSTNPAYLMNSEAVGIPVAFTGRVPCKVRGPVSKGDLLVTSAHEGYAEKMTDILYRPGCILGKALGEVEDKQFSTIEIVVGRF